MNAPVGIATGDHNRCPGCYGWTPRIDITTFCVGTLDNTSNTYIPAKHYDDKIIRLKGAMEVWRMVQYLDILGRVQ